MTEPYPNFPRNTRSALLTDMDTADRAEQQGMGVAACSGGGGDGGDGKSIKPQLRLALKLLRVARPALAEQVRDALDEGNAAWESRQ